MRDLCLASSSPMAQRLYREDRDDIWSKRVRGSICAGIILPIRESLFQAQLRPRCIQFLRLLPYLR